MRRSLAWLLILCLLIPASSGATGSASVPNTLANLAAGAQPLSIIDANFTALVNYINNREITIGVLSARPAASVSGRYYLASDTAGGTFYVDTGSTWTQVAQGVTGTVGTYSVRGLIAGTASLTVVNASATVVNLRNPSDNTVVARTATATISNDTLTAGPAVNGRDQSAQFTASTWVHVYYIWNGTTLGSLSSACAPSDANGACSQTGGPNLPTGYTHWAYIGAWRYNASSQYVALHTNGSCGFYTATQSALNAGVSTVEAAVNVTTQVPPNALTMQMNIMHYATANLTAAVSYRGMYRTTTGLDFGHDELQCSGCRSTTAQSLRMPNRGQNFYYLTQTQAVANPVDIEIQGFCNANGGE